MKVLVCDYTGISAQWLNDFAIKENLEVVGTITPDTDKKLLAEKDSWEYLLVFENGARQFFMVLAQFMNIPLERVIFALDWNSWAANPAAMYALLDRTREGAAYRIATFHTARQLNYFMSATTADGLHYVATSKDDCIMEHMYNQRKNYAEDDIKLFHLLAKEFYQVDDSEGLFLDIGANIGTTGIYFLKKLAPNLKLLAFEPDPENFKLLRTNLILNDVEKIATAENFGLGNEESEMTMYRMPHNPGSNGIYTDLFLEDAPSETVNIIPLDKYFAENKISPKDIKYIWIDTEGFEPQILLGAKNILTENPAPIFMEFRPSLYHKMGFYESMMNLLSENYSGYIWIQEKISDDTIHIHSIDELQSFNRFTGNFNALGDIFLIHEVKE